VATDRDDRRLAAPGDLELTRDFINTLDVLPDTDKIGDPPEDRGEHPGHRPTFDDPPGRKVAVERIDTTAAMLKEEGAVPVEDLSTAEMPIAAYERQLPVVC
jgi:hypothetical protein